MKTTTKNSRVKQFQFESSPHHEPHCYTLCVSRERIEATEEEWPGGPFLSNMTFDEIVSLNELLTSVIAKGRR
jgi:hypothetical protein